MPAIVRAVVTAVAAVSFFKKLNIKKKIYIYKYIYIIIYLFYFPIYIFICIYIYIFFHVCFCYYFSYIFFYWGRLFEDFIKRLKNAGADTLFNVCPPPECF